MAFKEDPKTIVECGYDKCAGAYNGARSIAPPSELSLLLDVLAPDVRVLDIGCGGGIPIASTLSQRASVIGVDISGEQIRQAKRNVPTARFVHGDIMAQSFFPDSFDAVVSFYTLFHLPRDQHGDLFARIAGWLKPDGYLLTTLAQDDMSEDVDPGFFGARMYWSHFALAHYEATLADLGFVILHRGVVGHGYRDVEGLPAERHPLVFAQLELASSRSG